MQKEEFYMVSWRKMAEESLGWGDSAKWNDIDFEKLSERIFELTGTMLSITTLKRVWGRVKYDSSPNAATLNAMAKLLGFDNWRAFKQSVTNDPVFSKPVLHLTKTNYRPVAGIAIAIVLGLMIFWSTKQKQPDKPLANIHVKFESKKVTDGLPNSVVFNYDASGLGVDSATLQQSWDPTRNEKIPTYGKEHTSIYYYPGYFTAKLIVNGEVKKESPVFIKTKGWVGILDKKPTPTYLSQTDIHLPGALGIPGKTFTEKTGSPVFNDKWVSFYNVSEFDGLNGGDFTLETTLRNTSRPEESSCRKVVVYILGKSNAMVIPLAEKGCISALDMYTSSEWIHGKEKDMSAFGCDFNRFQHFACSIKDMKLSVSLNNKQIFTAPITQTIGDIIGVSISFEGTGEIKDIKLGNKDKVMLQDTF
jgi:hypothetical protein